MGKPDARRGVLDHGLKTVERVPLMGLIEWLYRLFPDVRRAVYRVWYHQMSVLDKRAEANFANYGYSGDDPPRLDPADEPDRLCIQLYHHVCAPFDLTGRDVLEVGCGRGGGASYVTRYLKPRSMTGLDLNSRAIDFCRRHYQVPGLRFRAGSSESLPFPEASFDVVINVESSHCYGSINRFLCEVRRVLRPGGRFLFTDFRPAGAMHGLRRELDLAGFDVESETTITPNVFQALELDEERRLDLIRRRVPSALRAIFRQFAATGGTPTYEAFRTGRWEYASFVLVPRPADD